MIHHAKNWTGHRALVIAHGMGEHGGRYLHVPHFVQAEVDAVYCLDHRGHGRSEGARGHVERFDLMADDLAYAIRRLDEQLRKRFGGKSEIHLLGHSLGGHVALRTMFLHSSLPLSSVTISAPFLAVKAEVPLAKKMAARALSKVWGNLQLSTGLDSKGICRDPDVVKAYTEDRLVHDKMTPHFYMEMLKSFKDTLARTEGVYPPMLMIVPMEDRLVDAQTSIGFFEKLEHSEKRLVTFPEFYHEPLNEIGKEKAFDEIVGWIRAHHKKP